MIKRNTAQKILNTKAGTMAFNAVVMPVLLGFFVTTATFMFVMQKKH